MNLKLITIFTASLLVTSCAFAPGSHIPQADRSLFDDETRQVEYDEFSQADLEKLVRTYNISPMLLAELNQPQPKPEFNDTLQVDISNYDYRVGKGDVLTITVWNHPELTIPAGSQRGAAESGNWVHSDGTIFYPYVGRIIVNGMRVTEIRDIIAEKLAKYIESPQVDVTVAAFRSQRVYVTGEVSQPGVLPVTNIPMTLIEAVNKSGGLTENADWNRVILTRNDQDLVFNLRELYQQGNTHQNILLKPNDIVHIARNDENKVFVLGEVRRPQTQVMSLNGMTLAEALSNAGGIYEMAADPTGIFVIREAEAATGRVADLYQLNMKNATALVLAEQFKLKERDIIYVTAAPVARWNRLISQILPTVTGIYQVGRARDELSQ